MGNKLRRNHRDPVDVVQVRDYTEPKGGFEVIVPIRDQQNIVLTKRTGLQPFPCLPAFTVAIVLMEYAGTLNEMVPLLQRLCHTTRAYCVFHRGSLEKMLVRKRVLFHSNPTRYTRFNYADHSTITEWPSKEQLKTILGKSGPDGLPAQLKSITLFYLSGQEACKEDVVQLLRNNPTTGQTEAVKAVQSIQLHLNNGVSSPVVPFKNPELTNGTEQLMTAFNADGVKKISYKVTKLNQRDSFTSFEVSYHRVGDIESETYTEKAASATSSGELKHVAIESKMFIIGIKQWIDDQDRLLGFSFLTYKEQEPKAVPRQNNLPGVKGSEREIFLYG